VRRFACIVEGYGEVPSVPGLLRRISTELFSTTVEILHPIRIPKAKLLRPGELEKAIELAARKVGPDDAVLVLLDADDHCPAELGPQLLHRARAVRADRRIRVVLAKTEYEAWFIAAAPSVAGHRGLDPGLMRPPDPEAIHGAKEWLRDRCTQGANYREAVDQAALTAVFDLQMARSADSFDKLCRDFRELLSEKSQES